MRVEVTVDDIMFGCKWKGNNCPVAQALARATGSPYVWVSRTTAMLFPDNRYLHIPQRDPDLIHALKVWDLPADAIWRIHAFDCGLGMVPFTFDL